MTENENVQKSCKNCLYYSQHYTKRDTRYLDVVDCGHCKKNLYSRKFKLCELWEISDLKEKRKESIKETLRYMSERLDEIAMILKDDND